MEGLRDERARSRLNGKRITRKSFSCAQISLPTRESSRLFGIIRSKGNDDDREPSNSDRVFSVAFEGGVGERWGKVARKKKDVDGKRDTFAVCTRVSRSWNARYDRNSASRRRGAQQCAKFRDKCAH